METLTTILIIIGGVTLAIVCLVFVALLLWLLRLRSLSRDVENHLPGALRVMNRMQRTPVRIHLRPAQAGWGAIDRVSAAVKQLEELGYVHAGVYSCSEMPGLRLLALINQPERLTAVVYEMDPVGVWVDVVVRRSDGGSLTCTNSAHVGMLEQRPGHAKHSEPLRDAAHLHHLAMTGVMLEQRLAVTAEGFVTHCERAYADEMDWRTLRGAPDASEVARVKDRYQISLDDKMTQKVVQGLDDQARLQFEECLRARLLESSHLSASEWERVRDRLVFLHDRLTSSDVRELITEYAGEVPEGASDGPARELFQELNRRLPLARRFRHLASLDGILPADAWEPPQAVEELPATR